MMSAKQLSFRFAKCGFDRRQFHRKSLTAKRLTAILRWLAIALPIVFFYNSCHVQLARGFRQTPGDKPSVAAADSLARLQDSLNNAPQKIIYLTFDDGPNKGTGNVAALLKRKKLPATFFIVGSHVHSSEAQLAQFQNLLAHPDFEAANHSYWHAKNNYRHFYRHPEKALADFQLMRDSVRIANKLSRTPGANVWRTSEIHHDVERRTEKAANLLKSNDFTLVGWDVEWKADGKRRLKCSPEKLIAEMEKHFEQGLNKSHNHLVLLLHDQHFSDSTNLRALEKLMDELMESGEYGFRKVSAYPCL